jgi:hypothetical protein
MRRCAFCDREIEANAPPEHVIPKWIGREYPGALFVRTDREGRSIRSKTIDITAETVCKDCNGHWMSDLETWASPLLKPMLKGIRQGLTVEQQALLAQWATKTAMTLDQTYPLAERVFPVTACKLLMERKLPPPSTGVQLGRYQGTGDLLAIVHTDLYGHPVTVSTRPSLPEAHRTTVRIDKLVMEVNMTKDIPIDLRTTGIDIGDILLRIWPTANVVAWPPRHTFSDTIWTSFAGPDLPNTPR